MIQTESMLSDPPQPSVALCAILSLGVHVGLLTVLGFLSKSSPTIENCPSYANQSRSPSIRDIIDDTSSTPTIFAVNLPVHNTALALAFIHVSTRDLSSAVRGLAATVLRNPGRSRATTRFRYQAGHERPPGRRRLSRTKSDENEQTPAVSISRRFVLPAGSPRLPTQGLSSAVRGLAATVLRNPGRSRATTRFRYQAGRERPPGRRRLSRTKSDGKNEQTSAALHLQAIRPPSRLTSPPNSRPLICSPWDSPLQSSEIQDAPGPPLDSATKRVVKDHRAADALVGRNLMQK